MKKYLVILSVCNSLCADQDVQNIKANVLFGVLEFRVSQLLTSLGGSGKPIVPPKPAGAKPAIPPKPTSPINTDIPLKGPVDASTLPKPVIIEDDPWGERTPVAGSFEALNSEIDRCKKLIESLFGKSSQESASGIKVIKADLEGIRAKINDPSQSLVDTAKVAQLLARIDLFKDAINFLESNLLPVYNSSMKPDAFIEKLEAYTEQCNKALKAGFKDAFITAKKFSIKNSLEACEKEIYRLNPSNASDLIRRINTIRISFSLPTIYFEKPLKAFDGSITSENVNNYSAYLTTYVDDIKKEIENDIKKGYTPVQLGQKTTSIEIQNKTTAKINELRTKLNNSSFKDDVQGKVDDFQSKVMQQSKGVLSQDSMVLLFKAVKMFRDFFGLSDLRSPVHDKPADQKPPTTLVPQSGTTGISKRPTLKPKDRTLADAVSERENQPSSVNNSPSMTDSIAKRDHKKSIDIINAMAKDDFNKLSLEEVLIILSDPSEYAGKFNTDAQDSFEDRVIALKNDTTLGPEDKMRLNRLSASFSDVD